MNKKLFVLKEYDKKENPHAKSYESLNEKHSSDDVPYSLDMEENLEDDVKYEFESSLILVEPTDHYVPEKIVGATRVDNTLILLVKQKNVEKYDYMIADLVNVKYPQLVIEFYEKNLIWKNEIGAEKSFRDEYRPENELRQNNLNDYSTEKKKLDFGLIPEKIFGSKVFNGRLMFLVKWLSLNKANLVTAQLANINFPHLVIQFYENNIKWI